MPVYWHGLSPKKLCIKLSTAACGKSGSAGSKLKPDPQGPEYLFCLFSPFQPVVKTKLVSSWNDPTFTEPPMQCILIIGVMHTGLNCHMYEDALVKTLKQGPNQSYHGHTSVASTLK